MAEADTYSERPFALHLPAREIPVPTSVSPEAQAMLSMGLWSPTEPFPELDDLDGWRILAAARDVSMLALVGDRASGVEADVQEKDIDGVRVHVLTPPGVTAEDPRGVPRDPRRRALPGRR